MREQLEQLQKDAERSNVNIQVLPLGAALPVDVYPPFTIFRQRGEPPADVVWLEHITGGNSLARRRDVQRYLEGGPEGPPRGPRFAVRRGLGCRRGEPPPAFTPAAPALGDGAALPTPCPAAQLRRRRETKAASDRAQ
ncbi:Scr1 family TA system antitoxin-like transcriptional regulator [Streptomyces antimycoticus]|uniref:Scr1 family TA system antitoxin-like transcriptional regulator n=1 Tax=Streptomyces antimycoticus TaxID=68175 RepID=UPI00342FCBD6